MLVGSQVESVHTVTLNLKLNGAEWRSREPSGLLTSVSSLTPGKTNEGSASALDIECNRNAKAVAILCLLVFNTNNNGHILDNYGACRYFLFYVILLLFILKGEIINYELILLSIIFKFFEYQPGNFAGNSSILQVIPLRNRGKCPHRALKIQNSLRGCPHTLYIGNWSRLKPRLYTI